MQYFLEQGTAYKVQANNGEISAFHTYLDFSGNYSHCPFRVLEIAVCFRVKSIRYWQSPHRLNNFWKSWLNEVNKKWPDSGQMTLLSLVRDSCTVRQEPESSKPS
jgi:hypothetical protein